VKVEFDIGLLAIYAAAPVTTKSYEPCKKQVANA
ncbi:uncharacterized protein METZ01_LOCUS436515, partial [marine metagenome]